MNAACVCARCGVGDANALFLVVGLHHQEASAEADYSTRLYRDIPLTGGVCHVSEQTGAVYPLCLTKQCTAEVGFHIGVHREVDFPCGFSTCKGISAVGIPHSACRAARNADGHVIMYADHVTESMEKAIQETERRRKIQMAYNEEHGITPQTVKKSVRDLISISKKVAAEELRLEKDPESMSEKELEKLIKDVTKQMKKAAAELNFEAAAELRDKLIELKKQLQDMEG